MKMPVRDLEALVTKAFTAARTSEANARSVARALVQAEVDGQKGHGLTRVPSYTLQSRTGKVDGFATPTIIQKRDAALLIDAAAGFAYPAFDLAISHLPDITAKTGISAAAITRSHHCGALGRHVERLAESGLVALAFANTPDAMAPWGGKRRLFGTNPIAFAAPQRNGIPTVVDLALSQVARGKILSAANKGEPIPEGWATDADGNPTTDAKKALDGTLVPIGQAKGAALAFMVEVLAAALTGSNFAFEASSFFDEKGGPPGVGQLLLAIDPEALGGGDRFLDRMAVLVEAFDDNGDARLPGSRRLALRADARAGGVEIDQATLTDLEQRASEAS
jgi:(2R)-3-sulfolactate dehydrogenase (NADP+)